MRIPIQLSQVARGTALFTVGLIALAIVFTTLDFEPADLSNIAIEQHAVNSQVDVRSGLAIPVRTTSHVEGDDSDASRAGEESLVLTVRPLVPEPSRAGTPASATPPPYALVIPVEGVAAEDLFDSYGQARGSDRRHLAIDILAPTGTPVLAAAAGNVVRLHHSPRGGITLYIVDDEGDFIYYYAHLDGYAEGLTEGASVTQGEVIGFVGHSGNAEPSTPHLHFAIWKARPGRSFWGGSPVNPYTALVR